MKRRPARIRLAVAGILTLLLLAMTAVPTSAADVKRGVNAEDLAFHLTNCLRTGGWVTKDGKCMAYGKGKFSKYVKPLRRSDKISNKVAWPWARKSVQFYGKSTCWIGHARNGSTVKSRFRQAGLTARHGENMGCGFYGPGETVIRVIRMWQAERKYNGWHWRQVKDPEFRGVGVAVARYGKKVQFVLDLYEKKAVS